VITSRDDANEEVCLLLCATGSAVARLSYCSFYLSVRMSVRYMGGSVKNGAPNLHCRLP